MNSPQIKSARRFRDILVGCLDASYAGEWRSILDERRESQIVYLPKDSMFQFSSEDTPEAFLKAVDQAHGCVSAEDLYRHGLEVPATPVAKERIDAALRRQPLTLIIFPGIFSELVESLTFAELFAVKGSAFEREWENSLLAYRQSHNEEEVVSTLHDDQFDLKHLTFDSNSGVVNRHLGDLFECASLDDADGKALVSAVLFRNQPLSLETIGDVSEIARILGRRLRKFFEVSGVPDRIVLLGYSMGAITSTAVLAIAHERNEPWVANVRAVVGVGGVIHGSHLADLAMDPPQGHEDQPLAEQVRLLRELSGTLRVPRGLPVWRRPRVILKNSLGWLRFARRSLSLLRQFAAKGEPGSILETSRATLKSDPRPLLGLLGREIFRAFSFHDLRKYSLNILRFKNLIEAMLDGATSLTSRDRTTWWRHHVLPTAHIQYYALAGTMALEPPLADNPTTYNKNSLDHESLWQSYKDFAQATGLKLNDGQVAVSRAQFWPDLAALCNPAYRDSPLRSTFLGVMGEHHWGLVLPAVNPNWDKTVNPFPRMALFKAIAAQIAMDLEGGGDEGQGTKGEGIK